jgi:hypothetical protein
VEAGGLSFKGIPDEVMESLSQKTKELGGGCDLNGRQLA